MVLDYSKWDKLELSDDSDIEGHPNVDKASLIRWKQQDIHAKRQQRDFRIQQLNVNIETNTDLIERIDALITAAKSGDNLSNVAQALEIANKGQTKTKPTLATSPQQPLYNDMLESLLEQTQGKAEAMEAHRKMIADALKDETTELKKLESEKASHITMDDIRDGWNSTTFNKTSGTKANTSASAPTGSAVPASPTIPQPPAAPAAKQTHIETLNSSPSSAANAPVISKPKVGDDGLEELLPETEKFGTLPMNNLTMSGSYLVAHPQVITEGQKDALIMTAFNHQLAGESKEAENIIHQSLLIQYSAILGGVDGARKFLSRISDPKHPARIGFDEEVRTTTAHIRERCRILASENEQEPEEGVEQIQLHAVDPDTEIHVQVPEKDTAGYAIYEQFSTAIKTAIESKSLDKINTVLAEMSVPEAEELVQQLSESGVLMVEEKIYDVDEWQEKKQELEGGDLPEVEEVASPSASAPAPSTIDELD